MPKRLQENFGLEVEMLGGRLDDGVWRLQEGDHVRFRIKADQDAYVGVWTVEADGTVLQLFPNDDDLDHKFHKGEERVVPSVNCNAVPSVGFDFVWVQASKRAWNPIVGQKVGPFTLFKAERDRAALSRLQRGLRLPGNLSEKVLKYFVTARKRKD